MTDKNMKNGRKYVDSGFVHDTMDNVNDEHYFLASSRLAESLEQTPQRTLSRKTFPTLKDICGTEVTYAIW